MYLSGLQSLRIEKNDGKRKDIISKDVASFANSDGGIIIYGIKEENHKAHSTTFINGNEFTKEWLEQVINSTIQRHIPDVKIYPIREAGRIEKTIYIVKIPKSLEAPHISKDQRFYKRFNFMSVPMEEYEIRQLYGRTRLCCMAMLVAF
ncbi:MAG: ATP-binding protein [Spirosomataceae bacterium]